MPTYIIISVVNMIIIISSNAVCHVVQNYRSYFQKAFDDGVNDDDDDNAEYE